MVLNIENNTSYLNDYHFQTLCMLYYPGEKFPPGLTEAENKAEFFLEEQVLDGITHVYAKATLYAGSRMESAECCLSPADFSFDADMAFTAQASVGCAFLEAGKALFGFTPPWGYLTGLRPVKRARYYLDKGFEKEAVRRLFEQDHKVSPEKTSLSLSIAETEARMLAPYTAKDCCLYIAIPFCPTRCEYCSFVSYSNDKLFKTIPDYLNRLDGDLMRTARIIKQTGFNLRSVYIGGGTPSVLNEEQIARIMDRLHSDFDLSALTEFSFESGRPDTTTKSKLALVKSYGVDRVSINPQTTDNAVLKRIGRAHTAEQFFKAAEDAMSLGFDSRTSRRQLLRL